MTSDKDAWVCRGALLRCCDGFVIDSLFCSPLIDASLSSSSRDVAWYRLIGTAVVNAAAVSIHMEDAEKSRNLKVVGEESGKMRSSLCSGVGHIRVSTNSSNFSWSEDVTYGGYI